MTAPELSAREREIVARFEAGEAAPESWRPEHTDDCTCYSPYRCGIHEGMWP